MANPYRAFRQFERMLFRGVPEQPEPSWQRDSHALVPDRHTGKSQLPDGSSGGTKGKLIATIKYRPKSKKILYVRAKGKKSPSKN